jgi:hypothetical protein
VRVPICAEFGRPDEAGAGLRYRLDGGILGDRPDRRFLWTMTQDIPGIALTDIPSNRQRMFVRYLMATLIDLTVLNLFDEYWTHVSIDSFTISILAAILLQVLLKATLAIEHRVAGFFNAKSGGTARLMRFLSAWLILFGSKFIMLGAINFAFGNEVDFGGPLHGVVAFIAVVVAMLVAEEMTTRLYRRLAPPASA